MTLDLIIFITIATLLLGSIHYYLWHKLVKSTHMQGIYKSMTTYLLILLAISLPVAIAIYRFSSFSNSFPFLWLAFLWLGIMALLFLVFIFTDISKAIFYIFSKFGSSNPKTIDIEKRKFVSKLIATSSSAFVFGTSAMGLNNYYTNAKVLSLNVTLERLPQIFKGFKIVQISDLHVGEMMTREKLQEIVLRVNNLQPDLIAITGDLADGSTAKLLNEVLPLKNLKAKHGVFFVTGNHEYYSGVESWIREITKMGIKVLDNENIKIKKDDDYFYLAGISDYEAIRYSKKYATDFDKALLGLNNDKKKILLAHRPIAVRQAAEYGTDLVLSGHTHGGQIWPIKYLIYLQQPYLKGLYQHKNTKLYVNQGTGCWGPPMRLDSFNEITQIVLV